MKKIAIGAAAAFTVLLAALYIYAFTLPSGWSVEAERTIKASPDEVYALLADLETWPEWSNWGTSTDDSVTAEFGEKTTGKGASMSWNGEVVGEGRLELTNAMPGEKLEYVYWFAGREEPAEGTILLTPTKGGTNIAWSDRGEVDGNPLLRLLVGSIQAQRQDDIERELIRLDQRF